MINNNPPKRGQWKSQYGFVMAALGSAIGLGNIWRFPYMAYENGGGAFLIPYLIALLSVGIPLLILEFGIGHERIGSAPLAFAKYKKKWEWVGWWAIVFIMFGIELYYSVIISWCVNYFKFAFTGAWGDNPNDFFFNDFLGKTKGPDELGGVQPEIIIGLFIVWFVSWIIVYRGVSHGVELANKIFMPLLFILMAILVFWSLSLDGAMDGIKAYLTPDFDRLIPDFGKLFSEFKLWISGAKDIKFKELGKLKIWLAAYSQIFFSLGLGFGIMITYASYLPKKSNLTRSVFMIAFLNSGFSIFSGFAVFAVLGFMAHSSGLQMKDVVDKGIGLAFVAYPKALNEMPSFVGKVFGVLFFFSLVVAGLSSAISIIEAFVSAVIDKFHWNRKVLVSVLSIVGFLGGIIFTTGGGLFWLDIVDHFLTSYGVVVVGLCECLLVGWFFRIRVLQFHINLVSTIQIGSWWNWMIRIFVPLILIFIIVGSLFKEVNKPYNNYGWANILSIGVSWLVITIIVAVGFSLTKWKTDISNHTSRSDDYDI